MHSLSELSAQRAFVSAAPPRPRTLKHPGRLRLERFLALMGNGARITASSFRPATLCSMVSSSRCSPPAFAAPQ